MRGYVYIILTFFTLLLSTEIFADDLSTFSQYKNNFPLLEKDLAKLEALVLKNNSPQYNEMIKDMHVFKEQFDYLSNTLKLDSFIQDAKKNKWKNLERMAKDLTPICEGKESFNSETCKAELAKMKDYTLKSTLEDKKKEEITNFFDAYSAQITAFTLIDKDFITSFDKNAEAINSAFKESAKLPNTEVSSDAEFSSIDGSTSGLKKKHYVLIVSVLLILAGAGGWHLNTKKKKGIKKFYSVLFSIAKKNNIQLRVFGNLSISEAKILEKVQMPLLNTIYLSKGVSNKAQIKFKGRGKNISVEISYSTSKAIQSVMEVPKEKPFKDSIETLQKTVEENGGELIFTNNFNALGELSQSNVSFNLPK